MTRWIHIRKRFNIKGATEIGIDIYKNKYKIIKSVQQKTVGYKAEFRPMKSTS